MPKKPTQPQDKYVLRLPDGMRDRIKAKAEDNNRSMNAEIVATLEIAYPAQQLSWDYVSNVLVSRVWEAESEEDRQKAALEADEYVKSINRNAFVAYDSDSETVSFGAGPRLTTEFENVDE